MATDKGLRQEDTGIWKETLQKDHVNSIVSEGKKTRNFAQKC